MLQKVKYRDLFKSILFAMLSAMAIQLDYEHFVPTYNLTMYVLLILFVVFYKFMVKYAIGTVIRPYFLAILTSFFLLIGNSFSKNNSWDMLFGGCQNILQFLFAMVGYSILFFYLYRLIYEGLLKAAVIKKEGNTITGKFFGKYAYFKLLGMILLCWLPAIVLCYPGGSCVDVTYQISQTIGRIPYTTLHPLTHTLFVGFFVNLGENLFHSYNVGLYLQILVQSLILASIQVFSILKLKKRGLSEYILLGVLAIYCFAPMYSNFATMTIKDTLFNGFILLYLTFLTDVVMIPNAKMRVRNIVAINVAALLVMLFRNNGVYVVGATGIALAMYLLFGVQWNVRQKCIRILLVAILPIVLFFITDTLLTTAFHAETYSGKEMLSIPFQQTARYLRDYPDSLTSYEKTAIAAVLTDVDKLGEYYDPNISDPIKRQFVESATVSEILSYLGVWFKCGLRHPGVYAEALFNHCYGWFDVGLKNAIRYEGRLDIFHTPAAWGNSDKLMYYWFNLLNRVPILGLLENVGVYVWMMFLITKYLCKHKQKKQLILFAPLYISLLICIASPACLLHPRYAFPILFTLPYLIGLALCNESRNTDNIDQESKNEAETEA